MVLAGTGATMTLADGTVNPSGPPTGMYHVFRGGSWASTAIKLRCALRFFLPTTERHSDLGFRCAANVTPSGPGFTAGSSLGKLADADGDGAPDWWEEMNFGGGLGGVAVDSTKDLDGDGMITANEYVAGTDPTNSVSVLEIASVSHTTSTGQAITIIWQSVAGKSYSIERTDNLLGGFEPVAAGIKATAPANVYTDTVTGRKRYFYRIRVE